MDNLLLFFFAFWLLSLLVRLTTHAAPRVKPIRMPSRPSRPAVPPPAIHPVFTAPAPDWRRFETPACLRQRPRRSRNPFEAEVMNQWLKEMGV